jgi:hypothetical protein
MVAEEVFVNCYNFTPISQVKKARKVRLWKGFTIKRKGSSKALVILPFQGKNRNL